MFLDSVAMIISGQPLRSKVRNRILTIQGGVLGSVEEIMQSEKIPDSRMDAGLNLLWEYTVDHNGFFRWVRDSMKRAGLSAAQIGSTMRILRSEEDDQQAQ
jgi:hypothetical protein